MDELGWELAASLALLTAALDHPGLDVSAEVLALAAEARTVVQSYLGMTINVIGDSAVTLSAIEESRKTTDIRTSLRIPLLGNGTDGNGIELILYAYQPGAFVDLAADLTWLTGRQPEELRLDRHLQLASPFEGCETLVATSLINQAIGVMIGRGSTPAAAIRELDSFAASNAIARVDAASRILDEVTPVDRMEAP